MKTWALFLTLSMSLISLPGCRIDANEEDRAPSENVDKAQLAREAAESASRRAGVANSEQPYGFRGAMEDDCNNTGRNPNGVEVFIPHCPRTAVSDDGKWRLINTGVKDELSGETYIYIAALNGNRRMPVRELSDMMPFALVWSPRENWFFVDHHVGSFMQQPEVYEIVGNEVVHRDNFRLQGQKEAERINPCLPESDRPWVSGNVLGWSKDGGELAWVLIMRPDVCRGPNEYGAMPAEKTVRPMIMISNLDSGEIVEGSLRVVREGQKIELPSDGPYRSILGVGENE